MAGLGSSSPESDRRERVRFYLLDHRTRVGKAVDVSLLALNLAFVAVFVAGTYPLSASAGAALWQVEVGLAVVFLVEYVLRLYGAENRSAEFWSLYSWVDLASILPTFAALLLPGVGVAAAGLGFLRAVRVVRVLRFFRFTRDEEFFFGTVSLGTLRAMKLVLTVLSIFFSRRGCSTASRPGRTPASATSGTPSTSRSSR